MKCHGLIISHGGNVRSNNEDNAYLNGFYRKNDNEYSWKYEIGFSETVISAVFDGMGGEAEGEVASRIAAETLDVIYDRYYAGNDDMGKEDILFPNIIDDYVSMSSRRIAEYNLNNNMGTTFAALSFENDTFSFYNIGDSRGYLFRSGELVQMTKDHNLVRRMLSEGILTKEQAERHPHRNALYQFLGMKEDNELVKTECYKEELVQSVAGDIYLLCTDGLTEMVPDKDICNILSKEHSLGTKAEKLINRAREAGGRDNITIILIEVTE